MGLTWKRGEAVVLVLLFVLATAQDVTEEPGQEEDSGPTRSLGDVKSPDDVEAVQAWKDRCRDTAGDEALEEIEMAKDAFIPCISKHIKWDKLQHEINRSIPRGELDLVFKKYCGRRDRFVGCLEDVFSSVDVCLNEQEQRDVNVTRRAIDAGIDFVCHKDGDRIALFMAEEGEQCIKSQSDNIKECVEQQVPEISSMDDLLALTTGEVTINPANCKKLLAMHGCVVKFTERCEDPTPANILDSLITAMLKVTPCWKEKVREDTSGAPILSQLVVSHALTLVAAALAAANLVL